MNHPLFETYASFPAKDMLRPSLGGAPEIADFEGF